MSTVDATNTALAQHFFETLSSGDLEALRPMLHPHATWEVMRAEPRSRFSEGRDAIVDEFLGPVRGRFHPGDPQVIVDTLVASGRMVAAETRAVGAMLNGIAYANRAHPPQESGAGLLGEVGAHLFESGPD